jgi:predicted alpha/beta hydrolase
MKPLQVSANGVRSEARFFPASPTQQHSSPGLLVLPAMGVNARTYDKLGEALAAEGISALVAENRGGETSSVRAGRGVDYGYADLLDDLETQLGELKRHTAGAPSVLGHSLGGHLAVLGLQRWHQPGGKLIVIASGTVHHSAWSGVRQLGVFTGTQAAHVVARGLGYFPGHRLGFGGLQGSSLIIEWSNVARTGEFRSQRLGSLERGLDAVSPEVLALHVTGDTMAPRKATEGLLGKVRHAKVTWVDVKPPSQPRRLNPHFRWLREPATVAREVARFLRGESR